MSRLKNIKKWLHTFVFGIPSFFTCCCCLGGCHGRKIVPFEEEMNQYDTINRWVDLGCTATTWLPVCCGCCCGYCGKMGPEEI
jgi:hypothetical protein